MYVYIYVYIYNIYIYIYIYKPIMHIMHDIQVMPATHHGDHRAPVHSQQAQQGQPEAIEGGGGTVTGGGGTVTVAVPQVQAFTPSYVCVCQRESGHIE